MNFRISFWASSVLLTFFALPAHPQAANERGRGAEVGFDVLYLDSTTVGFDGGSRVELDDDLGLALSFGYRLNSRFEVQFVLDWKSVDYSVQLQSSVVPALSTRVNGSLDALTPQVNAVYDFLDGPITPYISGGIGWSFVDTNIPNGRIQVGCWWDPWWGPICTPYQSTRTFDDFAYQVGAGLRWDISPGYTFKLAYEKHWLELGHGSGTPDFDQLKLGLYYRY